MVARVAVEAGGIRVYGCTMRAKVSSRGQITIPKELRERVGIEPGQELELRLEGERIVVDKAGERGVFAQVTGILRTDRSTDELMAELRGEPDATDRECGSAEGLITIAPDFDEPLADLQDYR